METGIGQSKYRNLTLFHVVWSVPAKVFLTVTFSILSILTDHDRFGSDVEQDCSYTVFAAVFFTLTKHCIKILMQFLHYFFITRSSQPPDRPSPLPFCESDLLSSDNSHRAWNVQGVWSQIQLQGHFHPGAWLSHITSQETGPTRRETVKSETGELTWRQTTTGGRGARYYLTFVPRALPSEIRRAGKGWSRTPWQNR